MVVIVPHSCILRFQYHYRSPDVKFNPYKEVVRWSGANSFWIAIKVKCILPPYYSMHFSALVHVVDTRRIVQIYI